MRHKNLNFFLLAVLCLMLSTVLLAGCIAKNQPREGVTTQKAQQVNLPTKQFKILHIMSYHSPWKWTDDQLRGFKYALRDLNVEYKVYQMDKRIWEFGQLAIEMNLEDTFKENKPQSILAKLQKSEKGKEWFKKFMDYMKTDDVGGWRMRHFTDFNEPYWLEDPATPIGLVKDNIERDDDYDMEAIRLKLAGKREAAIASFLSRVPPDERDKFERLLRLAG